MSLASPRGSALAPNRTPLLFDALPALDVPFLPLAHVPTPVTHATALAEWLGRDDVWMKRDDLISPLYGGNKVRRFEYLLAEAKARGRGHLLTVGGFASTQVMATALFGQALGFDVTAVLFEQPVTPFAKAALLTMATAGTSVLYGGGYARTIGVTLAAWFRQRERTFFVQPGASTPLANLGYLDAMLELAAQVDRGELPRPDVIVVPSGSLGTAAALALGAGWLGWPTEIIAVRITALVACNPIVLTSLVHRTARFVHERDARFDLEAARRARFRVFHGAIGPGYGYGTPEAAEGAKALGLVTGSDGEMTYSGKGLAALRVLVQRPEYANKTFLYWNTLSTPQPLRDPAAADRLPLQLQEWARAGGA